MASSTLCKQMPCFAVMAGWRKLAVADCWMRFTARKSHTWFTEAVYWTGLHWKIGCVLKMLMFSLFTFK